MKLRRVISALIDFIILYSVYFTLQGIFSNMGLYAPFVSSIFLLPIVIYLFAKSDGIGKVMMGIENSYNTELKKTEKLLLYPVTLIYCCQIFLNAIYPFFVFSFGYKGLGIIAMLNFGLIVLLMVQLILLMIDKDYWNILKNNKVVLRKEN